MVGVADNLLQEAVARVTNVVAPSLHEVDTIRDAATGKWLNTSVFREEAINHDANGYYCSEPYGSPAWLHYWQMQLDRCDKGYRVGNWEITGDHYCYLNFTKIEVAVQISEDVAEKETKFPDFWDGDYDYFWSLKIARFGVVPRPEISEMFSVDEKGVIKEEKDLHAARIITLDRLKLRVKPHPDYLTGGHNLCVGKARRKGYSYKNGAICANTYNRKRKSLTIIGAHEKKFLYPTGTMQMASDYLNWFNQETGWAKGREYVDRVDHRKASYKESAGGVDIEKGYKSEIMALSFMDNEDAARGKDSYYVLLEEAGAFPNLEASYKATAPGLRAGKFATGQIIIFGTGGDMQSGTVDFAKMFYNPIAYNLMPFINIWDENAENSVCGFFHPFYWNFEGYYDAQGNSDVDKAIEDELEERKKILRQSAGSNVLQGRVQEFPMSPSEAFLTVSHNDFPIIELRNHYNKVIRERLHTKRGQAVHLFRDDKGKASMRPDLKGELEPIWDYVPKTNNLAGATVIYEAPISEIPKGLYKIGYDPYRQVNGSSLASIIVYKSVARHSMSNYNTIVAEFTGRPRDPDDVNRIAELLAELYKAEIMHENEVTHVVNYFKRRKKLDLLAAQPDEVISANIQNSKVARIWGMHMVDKLKDAGEKYIKQWLLEERTTDEYGNSILNLETINCPGLLEELILYNRKGNFDRVMAFMQVMFQIEEEDLEKVYDKPDDADNPNSMAAQLQAMMEKQFRKN